MTYGCPHTLTVTVRDTRDVRHFESDFRRTLCVQDTSTCTSSTCTLSDLLNNNNDNQIPSLSTLGQALGLTVSAATHLASKSRAALIVPAEMAVGNPLLQTPTIRL